MKKYILTIIFSTLSLTLAFGAIKKVPKGEKMKYKIEPAPLQSGGHYGSTPIVFPKTGSARNNLVITLIDSSTSGYGMLAPNTRPIVVEDDKWYITFRQYCGINTTHGQLGGAFSEDGEEWITYYNINYNGNPPWGGGGIGGAGSAQARYPNAVSTEYAPVSIWNEYTAITTNGSLYGGRPYYSYDEFSWDGGSFSYPMDIDLLWETGPKDLWVGSAASSYDGDIGMDVINVVYNDWTRGDRWLFHSEAYEDGFIVFGSEIKIIDEVNDLVGGDDNGSFNTSPYISCTPDGICMVGIVGLFSGADSDASSVSNNHTGIFKMSDDHGASWYGGSTGDPSLGHANSADGDGYYFIPDAAWDDLVATQFSYEITDECTGTTHLIDDFWSYYQDDMKVDSEGNPHFVIQVLPCDDPEDGSCWYAPEAGLYHFTIDRDYLDKPGPVNTPTGWNWSFVMSGAATWSWADMTGDSYIWNNHASLSFSRENPEVIYVVTNLATRGDFEGDPANLEDPCYQNTWSDYPEWSEDIYVVKSVDGGDSWWNPFNVTNTPDETGNICPNNYPKCDPAETYPHAAHWGTDEEVYFMYQMPNWAFNELGDLSSGSSFHVTRSGAGFMNRIYAGYVELTNSDIDPYIDPYDGCYSHTGDITGDGIINVLDVVAIVNYVLGLVDLADTCATDFTGDGIINILDIVGIVQCVLGIGICEYE